MPQIFSTHCNILNGCFVELYQNHSQALLPFCQISAARILCQHVRLDESQVQRLRLNTFGASVRWYRTALCHGVA